MPGGYCTHTHARPVPGQDKWNSDSNKRPDLRSVPAHYKLPAPAMLPAEKNTQQAVNTIATAIGIDEKHPKNTSATPVEKVTIEYDKLYHLVEKRGEDRERYANYILPTLTNPFEVWGVAYDDGQSRHRYIGLFHGDRDLMVSVRIEPDGSILWNIMQETHAGLNRQRIGKILYAKK